MKCPYCSYPEQKVLESRPAREDESIRRRRECLGCGRRFTTFEEIERPRLLVVKRNGSREDFDREKLLRSLELACGKRPVGLETLREAVVSLERELVDSPENEIKTSLLGQRVLAALRDIDEIAFVRYASVYLEFESPAEFSQIVSAIKGGKRPNLARTDESVAENK